MSRHHDRRRRRTAIWIAANGVVLLALTSWLLSPSLGEISDPATSPPQNQPALAPTTPGPAVLAGPTKAEIMAQQGIRFGVSLPQGPWDRGEVERVSAAAGATPTMIQYFVKWNQDFRPDTVQEAYGRAALPVISWEPWDGADKGFSQPKYALKKIINGEFDEYITRFATGVRDQRVAVGIRLAHEMNGHWYPWSEQQSGNRKGEYVLAWRHVHDIFTRVGADNAIWIWSPNILRPVPNVSLKALYPGDAYVDWAGMVGYDVNEPTAAVVFDPTLKALAGVTGKPVVITETGAQPGTHKAAWISDLFRWLPKRPQVIGFIWFEFSEEEGGRKDWRFSHDAAATNAFRNGLKQVTLAPAPVRS